MIFESHAHYDDEMFEKDREQLLSGLSAAGVGTVVNVASSFGSVKTTLELTEKWPFVYGALGVHPSEIDGLREADMEWLKERLSHPRAVAVGEIGLDYYWEKEEPVRASQKEWFARQLALAGEVQKPVIVHSRDAMKDTWDVMAGNGAKDMRGVIHCFSYTKESAREYLKWDFYLGIGGVVTFKNARAIKEVVEYVPLERILLETDCPYLSPEPYRGKRNSSLNLPYVAQAIAEIKGVTKEQVEETTCRNACRLFGI